MTSGGNVLAAITWGMRRYWWLVTVFVVGIGFLLPAWQSQGPEVYEAKAQVGPTRTPELPNLDPLPRAADTAFDNGAVQAEIRQLLDLKETDQVIPRYVELVAGQDNFIFEVVGRGSSPTEAVRIANTAASVFVIEMGKYDNLTGGMAVQSFADPPRRAVPTLGGGPVGLALGILGGALLGTGVVVLLVILRRPIVDTDGAEQISGVAVLGRLRVPRSGEPIDEVTELAHIVRAVLPHDPQVVWLAAPHGCKRAADQLAAGLAHVWERVEQATMDTPTAGHPDFVVLERPGEELLDNTRPSMTLLVVPVGMRGSRLRRMARGYFTGAPMSVVMFSRKGILPPFLQEEKPKSKPVLAPVAADVVEGTPSAKAEQHLFGGSPSAAKRPKPAKGAKPAKPGEPAERGDALSGRR
jgi:capsular polysaccharide biosynthesis protein